MRHGPPEVGGERLPGIPHDEVFHVGDLMVQPDVNVETQFARDLLSGGVAGLTVADARSYLEYVADQRLANLGLPPRYGTANPFDFMALQGVQELANFFERRVSAYQVGVTGEVGFDEDF